jgi:hypothetical protein
MSRLQLVGDVRSKGNAHQRGIRPILAILPKRVPLGIFPSIGRLFGLALLFLMAIQATSCVVVDHFSHRAVQYNREAEQIQDQDLLLNIVRASKRRPLEFSGLQTVSGTGQSSGGISMSWPIHLNNATAATTLNPTVAFSGGPTFAVGVLDTQDFFEGILSPIPLDTLDLYYQERYSATMLFNLFIEKIVIKQGNNVLEIPNNVGRDVDVDGFQATIDYLLNLGLSTQSKSHPTLFGPLLSRDEAADLADLSRAATAGLEVKQVQWCDMTDPQLQFVFSQYDRNNIKSDITALKDACSKREDQTVDVTVTAIPGLPDTLPLVLFSAQKPNKALQLCFQKPPDKVLQRQHATIDPETYQLAIANPMTGKVISKNDIYRSAAACGDNKKNAKAASPTPGSSAKSAPPEINENTAPAPSTEFTSELGLKQLVLGEDLAKKLNALDSPTPEAAKQWYKTENAALDEGAPSEPIPLCLEKSCSIYHGIDFTKEVKLSLTPRSAEGVLYYLGEIVRREIEPDQQLNLVENRFETAHRRTIMIKYNPALHEAIPDDICLTPPKDKTPVSLTGGFRCEPMFVLDTVHHPTLSILGVMYEATGYQVPDDPIRGGRSTQLLDINLQLIGLFKSAKALPTNSVFTLISPP